MDTLDLILKRIDSYVAGLIDVADMSDGDKEALKTHLLAAQEILARNAQRELGEIVNTLTQAVLSRF